MESDDSEYEKHTKLCLENKRMVVNAQDTSPCTAKNGREVSLAHLRNISREERDREIANNVSTELTVPDIWKFKKQLTICDVGSLAHLRNISREERDLEIANKVSTELTVSIDDIWEFKKQLTMSDVGPQTRFLIPKDLVYKHILKYLTEEEIKKVQGKDHKGLNITVFDSNTRTIHSLCFKRWNSAGSYIFNKTWRDFVVRRKLKQGYEIGLFWNPYASRLHFRVLAKNR